MNEVPFQSFHNRYAGQVGWVIGRGETTFDYDQLAEADGPVFFINDAVALAEKVRHWHTFWFALDEGHHQHLPSPRALPVLHRGGWAEKHLLSLSHVCWWGQDPTAWNCWPPDLMAHSGHLITKIGTIIPLIHFAWFAGVRRLHLVGCDGIQPPTFAGPGWDPRLPNLSGKGGGVVYGRIRKEADNLMERLGIEATYIGTPAPKVYPPDLMVIAYYTDDRYKREADRLRQSLLEHGLKHRIDAFEDRGSWAANTSAKPTFIRRMMYAHNGPVLYLDADAVVQRPPKVVQDLRPEMWDIAVHYRERDHRPYGSRLELLSGTIWLGNTPACKRLVELWEAVCQTDPGTWDQRHLERIIRETPDLRVFRLPPEYCFIFDSMCKQHPDAVPVIEHFQASRRYKERQPA